MQISSIQRDYFNSTVSEYRAYCRALSYVVMGSWTAVNHKKVKSVCSTVERLIHKTKHNPNPRHRYFDKRFPRFPSYLRRAAIEFVVGQVSSYQTRYNEWLVSSKKKRGKPPAFNPVAGCYPTLYKKEMFKIDEDYKLGGLCKAQVKVFDSKQWVWTTIKVIIPKVEKDSSYNRIRDGVMKSPSLIVKKGAAHLSVPFEITTKPLSKGVVCAVDIGINTLAVASIVDADGTVLARKFMHPAKNIARRDHALKQIQKKASLTKKLTKGFCSNLYRKAGYHNDEIAYKTAKSIIDFALANGASTIALENLKGFKPRGKGSRLKLKFHGWLHRKLALKVEERFQEYGGKVFWVYARGTSSHAFDGSGKLARNKDQYELATFKSGKQYNCDLSASYNIGARAWVKILGKKKKAESGNDSQGVQGKSSCTSSRIPTTLSTLWRKAA